MSHQTYGDDRRSLENVELGTPLSRGQSRTKQDERAPNRPSDYFNYHPPILTLILSFAVWLILLLVCFVSPSGGLTVVFEDGGDYVGVLRKCTASSCDAWMATAQSSSSSSSSGSSNPSKRAATTSDLSNFYLTTGLATLASFWLMTYSLLFIIIRYFSTNLPTNDHKPEISNDGSSMRRMWRGFKNPIKKFAFETSRIFLFFLSWTMLGVAFDATIKVFSITGGSGFGMGVILLHLSHSFLFFLTFLEISRGSIRRKVDLSMWGCKCFQFCPSYNRRARRKWEDYDAARGRSTEKSKKSSGKRNARQEQVKEQSREERYDEAVYG
ncbi:uncharacterized protein L199_006366 [Kwoniella botswanensis]|uniref:uncharacterized protein n=1 Tax=Kwoniella botswanensis TaxID=1268659 RepID=UPI00315D59F5